MNTCATCKHHDPAPIPVRYYMNGRWITSGVNEYRCRLDGSRHYESDHCPNFEPHKPTTGGENTTIDNEHGDADGWIQLDAEG